jgi:hypothetical protein
LHGGQSVGADASPVEPTLLNAEAHRAKTVRWMPPDSVTNPIGHLTLHFKAPP